MKTAFIKKLACFFAIISLSFSINAQNNYTNPVLGGDYPDPSIVRVGKDYYMTHSSFEYYPGLLVWHSTDLVNWKRISFALQKYVGSVWAPDLIYHKGMYYIYFPAGGTNWVVTAKTPYGPWSEPVDMKLPGFIDPGHMLDYEGNRYLYLSKGYVAKLSEDGLKTVEQPRFVYEGWEYPKEWSTECFCLESPKMTTKDGYFYMTVAQGGTAGPATSHMVVSARSKSPYGPWVNSPYNPIVHTESRDELWWSQGHGSLVDDINGNWWILYHAYEKGFHTLGRQTLMLPVEWTSDDWFIIKKGVKSDAKIQLPAGEKSKHDTGLSDNFNSGKLGLQWQFFKDNDPKRISFDNGSLLFAAKGNSFDNTTPLLVNTSERKYEVTIEYTIDEGVTAGLCLYYNETANARISVDTASFAVFNQKNRKISEKNTLGRHGFLKILNDDNEVSFYYSSDSKIWNRVERSLDMTGFNHNVFGGFMSLRAGIFAYGKGRVRIEEFKYNSLY